MARHDVYPIPGRREAGYVPEAGYVVDVQSDLLSSLTTRVVVPLLPEARIPTAATRLNPIFEIAGQRHVLIVQSIATVPRRELREAVASLKDNHDTILAAIDFLLTGF